MKHTKITRRNFLVASGTLLAGSLIAACTKGTPAPTIQSTPGSTTQPVPTTSASKEAPTVQPTTGSTAQPVPTASASKEAPMLATLVAAGTLPPLSDRLPKEPMVVKPLEGIGKYGGALEELVPEATGATPGSWWAISQAFVALSIDLKTIVPEILKSYELSDDGKTLTCHMREGMKWSDGEPLTSEDVQFWYEDIVRSEDLTPGGDLKLKPGGQWMTLVVPDAYTFQMVFGIPYPRIEELVSSYGPVPKHYLKQWHITYNAGATDLAKTENYEFWHQAFLFHANGAGALADGKTPTLMPWIEEIRDTNGSQVLVRNPYFWKVDTEGNQLPYADRMKKTVTGSMELVTTRFLAGEGTHNGYFTSMAEYPLYHVNEEKGGYTTYLFRDNKASQMAYVFNYCHKDPILRDMFRDLRFRKAMSLAINRQELNSLYYAGLAVPRHPFFDPDATFYVEGLDNEFVEYDPEQANALLDEMGLKWDANHEWRLRSDGTPIKLHQDLWPERNHPEMAELIRGYWKACGIDLTIKISDSAYIHQVLLAAEQDLVAWNAAGASEWYARKSEILWVRPPWNWQWFPAGGTCWFRWMQTAGAEGEEPPAIIQELWKATEDWLEAARGTDIYKELGRKIMQINGDNIWAIGTIGLSPRPVMLKNTLRNVPRGDVTSNTTLSTDYSEWKLYLPEQWWLEA